VVSVTPFGQDGPKARWAATDLTLYAASGGLALTGDPDRAPLRVSVPQIWAHAATTAAAGALLALHERASSGRGQHVDISAQQVATVLSGAQNLAVPARATLAARAGGGVNFGGLKIRMVWDAKDGHVSITHVFGDFFGPFTRRLMEWVHEEGFCDAATRDKDWVGYGMALATGAEPPEAYAAVQDCIAAFTASKTKAELLAGALERRVLVAPVADMADVAGFEQLAVRGFWHDVDDPHLGRHVRAAHQWAHLSATPLQALGPPPQLGAHDAAELAAERRAPAGGSRSAAVASHAGSTADALPLAGLKVVDFCWVYAGPLVTRALADFGATVVRVESSVRLDGSRGLAPFLDDQVSAESSLVFSTANAGKLGVTVDLERPEARSVLVDLVSWADVVVEAFSPRAMKHWGLDYEALRRINPGLVMLSTCLMGQTGPLAQFSGFGNLAGALCGYYSVTGWPDRAPVGPFGAYTDYFSPPCALTALLAALDHRRRTGEGQYVDFSQAEASLLGLAPALLDLEVNGRVATAAGNDDIDLAPHGVYPAAGDDAWVAIAVTGDDAWQRLCGAIGRADLAADSSLATAEGRRAARRRLDAEVGAWTATLPARAIEERLQAVGVAVHEVQNSPEAVEDAQLRHRGHFVAVEHCSGNTHVVDGPRIRLSRTPAGPRRAGPGLNEHLFEVLNGLLGYSPDRIADLVALGIF
jgi:crotonobetainyl-CoA:carnitine CoA-transferase CaiB-like acyl-CoA transferase